VDTSLSPLSEGAPSVTQRALSVTQRALSDTQRALSVTQRALSVTQRALSDTQRALSVTQRALSVTQRALSVTQRALSVTQRALSVTQRALSARTGRVRRGGGGGRERRAALREVKVVARVELVVVRGRRVAPVRRLRGPIAQSLPVSWRPGQTPTPRTQRACLLAGDQSNHYPQYGVCVDPPQRACLLAGDLAKPSGILPPRRGFPNDVSAVTVYTSLCKLQPDATHRPPELSLTT
jgi:hypothetical protein